VDVLEIVQSAVHYFGAPTALVGQPHFRDECCEPRIVAEASH